MIEAVLGVLVGIAAHQSDRVVKQWPVQWEYLSRYIIGYLSAGLVFALLLKRLRPEALNDGVFAYGSAGVSVGLGVSLARLFDELFKSH